MSFLFALRRGRGESPRSAERNSSLDFKRKTSRPLGANTLTQFAHPAQPVQRKRLPPVRGEPLMRFVYPAQPVPHREKNDF